MPTNITKVSGVVIITEQTGKGKYYASALATRTQFSANPAGDGFTISIGADNYQILRTDLQVNGQTPATMTTALVLLNSVFGT